MDYYSLLGIRRDATNEDVKAAFRKLALEYHPDKHQDSTSSQKEYASARFKQVKDAYEVLGDAAKRELYNRGGHASVSHAQRASPYGSGHGGPYGTWTPRTRSGWSNFKYQQQRHNRHGWFLNSFSLLLQRMTRADAAFHLGLGVVFVGGTLVAAGVGDSLWDYANQGKLFKHIKQDDDAAPSVRQQAEKEFPPTPSSTGMREMMLMHASRYDALTGRVTDPPQQRPPTRTPSHAGHVGGNLSSTATRTLPNGGNLPTVGSHSPSAGSGFPPVSSYVPPSGSQLEATRTYAAPDGGHAPWVGSQAAAAVGGAAPVGSSLPSQQSLPTQNPNVAQPEPAGSNANAVDPCAQPGGGVEAARSVQVQAQRSRGGICREAEGDAVIGGPVSDVSRGQGEDAGLSQAGIELSPAPLGRAAEGGEGGRGV